MYIWIPKDHKPSTSLIKRWTWDPNHKGSDPVGLGGLEIATYLQDAKQWWLTDPPALIHNLAL